MEGPCQGRGAKDRRIWFHGVLERTPMDLEAPPATIHVQEELTPRGPWSFLRPGLPGGSTPWGWGLIAAWALAVAGPTLAWGAFLWRTAGWSALPAHWGEGLTARDIWEMWENGGLKHHAVNSPTIHLFGLGIVLALWCGWRMQAETAGLPGKLGPWLLGALDTLFVGLIPFAGIAWCVSSVLGWMGRSGIQGLGWAAFFGRPLVAMAAVSVLSLQWWFLRMGRALRTTQGSRSTQGRHLGWHARMIWDHPIQWTALILGGAAARAILASLPLILAWRLGGATVGRVWAFCLLELGAAALNAWILGWFLRTAALFWNHDLKVRQSRADFLEARREAKLLDI